MKERTLALAGLMQAAALVHRIAHVGSADGDALAASLESIFRIDADSVAAVYGGTRCVRLGLQTLLCQLDGDGREPALTRIAVTVLHVERRLAKRRDLLARVRAGVQEAGRQAAHLGTSHPTVLQRLAEVYGSTISTLRPRVLVQGNPQYLAQDSVVAEIRAVLLAAVRSAVLWRQVGGRYPDFLLRRRGLATAARSLLEEAGALA
jgi:high frequency lysogenization protein